MAGRNLLCVPGPTNIPLSIQKAMEVPQEDHRRPDFNALTVPLFERVKDVVKMKDGQVFLFPATGTAGWEVAVVNTLTPGDKVLTSRFGQFSHLWHDLAIRQGLDAETIDVEWGYGVPMQKFRERLSNDSDHKIKALLICHNETATGVINDLVAIRKMLDDLNHPALLFVDGVSSIASVDFRMDEWGIDIAISGSQKGFMLPAGMCIVCFGPKALDASKKAGCNRCFLDINDHISTNSAGFFPYTPSVPLLYGLKRSLEILLDEEGLENVIKRHHRLAEGVRKAVKAWGLELIAKTPDLYSDTVSAVCVPEHIDARDLIEIAYYRYNVSLGAGLAVLSGKVFRIGHLGDHNEASILSCIALCRDGTFGLWV